MSASTPATSTPPTGADATSTAGITTAGSGAAGISTAGIRTPVGQLSVASTEMGVTSIRFRSPQWAPADPAEPGPPAGRDDLAAMTAAQLGEYFAGQRRAFDLPLDRSALSPLQRRVLGTLFDSVPFGQTITYGELARRAGVEEVGGDLPARVIGQVMGSNPHPVVVPCHRVVAADGIGGYSGGTGIEIKRWLLIFEGSLPPTLDWTPQGPAR